MCISAGLIGVPQLLASNVDPSRESINNCHKEYWIIFEHISGESLFDFAKRNKCNLRDGLRIARQILTIVKQIHDRNMIHRNIHPKNILVRGQSDEINLTLFDFDSAWYDGCQDITQQLGNDFYRMPQFEERRNIDSNSRDHQEFKQQRCSPTIDATGVCAILFWLITGREPRESRDISDSAPHNIRDNGKMITKKISDMTGKVNLHSANFIVYLSKPTGWKIKQAIIWRDILN